MTYKSAQVYTGSEWVDLAVSIADPHQRSVQTLTSTTITIDSTHAGKALILNNLNPITLTIPEESTTNFVIGQTFILIQYNTGVVTVSPAVGVTLRSLSSRTKTNGQYSEARLIKIASNEWLLSGDITT